MILITKNDERRINIADIDEVLAEVLQKNRPVSIQLNQKDSLGRQTESIVGDFRGSPTGNKIFGMATVFLTNFIRCRTSFRMLFRLSLTMSLLGCDDLRQELTVKVRLPR